MASIRVNLLEIAWVKDLKDCRDKVNNENQYERGTNVCMGPGRERRKVQR